MMGIPASDPFPGYYWSEFGAPWDGVPSDDEDDVNPSPPAEPKEDEGSSQAMR